MKRQYSSILATGKHQRVTSLDQFNKWNEFTMGFFLNGVAIGDGELMRVRYLDHMKSTCLQTEGVSLIKKFRRKGHGIHLYHALIRHAKRCGAARIYSSKHLNKFSRRMWSEKLKEFYDVREVKTSKPCDNCGSKHRRIIGYYIVLKGK